MKKLFNIFMVLLAFALATTAFVSCKNDSDDDDSSSSANVVASFYDAEEGVTYDFYDDHTVKAAGESATWSGDISTAGTIYADGETLNFVVSGNTMTIYVGGEEVWTTLTKK